jgi:Fe-S cluster assembly protein SufD
VLDEGASLTLVERCDSAETRNTGFEIVLGRNARLDHVRIAPNSSAVLVEEISMTLANDAQYRGHFANFGAKLSRLELAVALQGAGAGVDLSGVSVLSGSAHADVTTHVTHAVGQTQSVQLFKKVVGGGAQAIYQGKVTVAPDADGSDSRQTAKALLLGARAEADLKPELEILADDVKCAHGAAVGDLDADSLFYLKSRGIPENDARHLLLHAFLEDAVEGVANTDLREMVRGAVANALEQVTA